MTTPDELLPADWIHPPPGVTEVSLGQALRYGAVLVFQCDRLRRTAFVEILPCTDAGTPEPAVLFALREVSSTRAVTHALWPGGLTIPPGASQEEQIRLVSEFKAKCTEVSVEWATCETALAGGDFAVLDAGWIASGGVMSFCFDVTDGKTRGFSIFLRCGGAEVTSADGTALELGRL
jgi:hypothetical protein